MVDPTVILLDEPTAGLSPAYTDVVWNQIGFISRLNTAVVVVEQNVERALKHRITSTYSWPAGTTCTARRPRSQR